MMRCHLFTGTKPVQSDVTLDEGMAAPEGSHLWVDIEDPREADLRVLHDQFRFHHLAIEDTQNAQRRSKYERYATHNFLVINALDRTTQHDPLDLVAICMFVRPKLLVTVRPKSVQAVDRVLDHVQVDPDAGVHTSERLLHAIIDAVVDEFLPLLDEYEEELTELQARVGEPGTAVPDRLVTIRRELLVVRRIILPHLEVVRRLTDPETADISPEIRLYFRDVLDHAMIVNDTDALLLEIVNGTLQLHANVVNERLNEVMKFLTIASVVMLPWTVISGIFGMNFDIIPIAHQQFGFYVALLAMTGTAAGLFWYFRRKGWTHRP
jgi:magnesium transporter